MTSFRRYLRCLYQRQAMFAGIVIALISAVFWGNSSHSRGAIARILLGVLHFRRPLFVTALWDWREASRMRKTRRTRGRFARNHLTCHRNLARCKKLSERWIATAATPMALVAS